MPDENPGNPVNPTKTPSSVLPEGSLKSYLIIGVAMMLLLLGVEILSSCYFERAANTLTDDFKLASPPINTEKDRETFAKQIFAKSAPTECSAADAATKDFILRQRAQIVLYGDGHRRAAIKFGSHFFSTVTTLGVFGFISLICLAVIASQGVGQANANLKAIFLIAAGIGVTYQAFFGVYQQKANIVANMDNSLNYVQLVKEIDTWCATGKLSISDPKPVLENLAKNPGPSPTPTPAATASASFHVPLEAVDFILYVDWKMKTYRKFAVAFDDKAVSNLTDTTRPLGL